MFKRIVLMLAAALVISAGSSAMAHHPYRGVVRSYYAPVPVVRHYPAPVTRYYSPYRSYYSYGYPAVRSYYYGPSVSYYVPSYSYVRPYSGVSVAAPGVSLRIGF